MVRTILLASVCQKAAKLGAIFIASAVLTVLTTNSDSVAPSESLAPKCNSVSTAADVVSISGSTFSSAHHLQWTTANESNSYYFEVRRSYSGSEFSAIGHVMAAGMSSSPVNYHFTDAMAPEGEVVYQLALIDFDGNNTAVAKEISLVKTAVIEKLPFGFEVFNSLKTQGTIKVILSEQSTQMVTISIADLSGNNLVRQKVAVDKQGISESFMCNCDAGVYFVSVIANQKMRSKTLIIGK